MQHDPTGTIDIRLAELIAALSLATDLGMGQPLEWALCTCVLAVRLGDLLRLWTHGAAQNLILGGAYTALYNVLGYPAGVVPVTRVRESEELGRLPSRDLVQQAAYKVERGSAGLPIGVQVVARPWREHVALSAMQAIENAMRAQPDFPVTPVLI